MIKKISCLLFLFTYFFMGCTTTPMPSASIPEGGAVAVWNLEDVSPMPPPIQGLEEILSGEVIKAVGTMEKYIVVEREKLLLALEELKIGTSELADENTRLRLGHLVGARWMIFGGYQVIGNTMRLDMRRVHVETGQVVKASTKEATATDISGWIQIVKEATRALF